MVMISARWTAIAAAINPVRRETIGLGAMRDKSLFNPLELRPCRMGIGRLRRLEAGFGGWLIQQDAEPIAYRYGIGKIVILPAADNSKRMREI